MLMEFFKRGSIKVGLVFFILGFAAPSTATLLHLNPAVITEQEEVGRVRGGRDSAFGNQTWPFHMVRANLAHQKELGKGEGVTICLMSSGIHKDWPGLKDAILDARNFVPGEDPNDISDSQTHYGSVLASLAVSRPVDQYVGIAPAANLIVAKVFDRRGTALMETVTRGFEFCKDRADIFLLSFGGGGDAPLLDDMFRTAVARGKAIVAGGGQSGPGLSWPAKNPLVIGVGVVDESGRVTDYSPRDEMLSFVAPGHKLPITVEPGRVLLGSGTSFAAAITAGIEALRRSRGSRCLVGRDLGLPVKVQGAGLIDADLSTN